VGPESIEPSGFERLHRDRSETYLVGDSEFDFEFEEDGTFNSNYTVPGQQTNFYTGNWRTGNNVLFLEYLEPIDFSGIREYRIPHSDDSNLDLQWSVGYDEFTDSQIEAWSKEGLIGPDGWRVDKDSMLANFSTPINATITLHFTKVD